MPPDDECRDDGLIPTGRGSEEIDHRDLSFHRVLEPAVIGCGSVGPHELVIDDIITSVDLAMSVALIVIPDSSAPSREHRLDAQQAFHLARLQDSAGG